MNSELWQRHIKLVHSPCRKGKIHWYLKLFPSPPREAGNFFSHIFLPSPSHFSSISWHLSAIYFHLLAIYFHLLSSTCHLLPSTCHLSAISCHFCHFCHLLTSICHIASLYLPTNLPDLLVGNPSYLLSSAYSSIPHVSGFSVFERDWLWYRTLRHHWPWLGGWDGPGTPTTQQPTVSTQMSCWQK